MRLSLIGMAGSGKSYWSRKLAEHGFRRFCCDDMIEAKLAPELTRSDGTMMKVAEWMGFPYGPHYQKCESQYLAYETEVLTEILDCLENHENNPGENIVVEVSFTLEKKSSEGFNDTQPSFTWQPHLRFRSNCLRHIYPIRTPCCGEALLAGSQTKPTRRR